MTEDIELYCKCGGLLSEAMAGDEAFLRCNSCRRFWLNEEDWMKQ